jgi:hypothetical protein
MFGGRNIHPGDADWTAIEKTLLKPKPKYEGFETQK